MQSFPLVSIIVLGYNSSEFIIETLNSIKTQTYPNIELLINDDNSKDNTAVLCKEWISLYGGHFKSVKLITSEKNLGVSASFKIPTEASSGLWIKYIAGDDLLLPRCIAEMLLFAVNGNYECIIADMKALKNNELKDYTLHQKRRSQFFKLSISKKYKSYVNYPFFLNAPSGFYKKTLLDRIKPFDEKYRLMEDQQLFLLILKDAVDIGYMKMATVVYRLHDTSLTGKFNINLYGELYNCFLAFRKPDMGHTPVALLLKASWESYYKNIIENYRKPTLLNKVKNRILDRAIRLLALLNN